ncbi:hypothetical protein M413DRAFT_68403 [Hebeloma cylindrosporum]|uniref:Enhancer of polycomb-like protein n=1 Tax=Hebeloma cylindrosporum TaxID=76867 RepID=A0A0C2YT02_HEBCY|nr:hypothetical protein M413DRAFT_68403 [Hebeloma cylindrosporum h7]
MPRNPHAAASTLRNRNRITNKTRLKIHQGPLDADNFHIADEDEERHQITTLAAGVDAEESNEHHLQEILSAVHRNNVNNRTIRGSSEKPSAPTQAAFIPTPDSTGIVDNYEELYSSKAWKDPSSYVCTSQTVEESIDDGIANGFTYYMDERDKEWLDKNNEHARGEGTSAQGALSSPVTRTSARSSKAKGKDPETLQPVIISEDEFELVMGVFEKVTHERTAYLHHVCVVGLETGMDFPAFSDYHDVFSAPLPPTMFATYTVPPWISPHVSLLRIAKAVYGYWKERKLERKGHRIIPIVNGDESDTLNESYICFRRRETKVPRKTRSSQVTSSDKLARLQAEFALPLKLANSVLARESLKKASAIHSRGLWERRLALADLKRKFPSLHDKGDEELLVDKEKPSKRDNPRLSGQKNGTNDKSLVPCPPPAIRPKDRQEAIHNQEELFMARRREIDHHWDDQVDDPYQALLPANGSNLFTYIPPPDAPSWPSSSLDNADIGHSPSPPARAVRLRYGRLGRSFLDRCDAKPRRVVSRLPRSSLFALEESDNAMDVDEDEDEVEIRQRQEERWKYDDDAPFVASDPDEQDRILVDDYDPTYLRHAMTLFADLDHWHLINNPAIPVVGPKGVIEVNPFKRSDAPPHPLLRPELFRPHPRSGNGAMVAQMVPPTLPVAMPATLQQENKQMLPPSAPASGQSLPIPISQHSQGLNGTPRVAVSMPHVDAQNQTEVISAPNDVASLPPSESTPRTTDGDVPARPPSQNAIAQAQVRPVASMNGYHFPSTNPAPVLANSTRHPNGLSPQQMQHLHTIFSNMPPHEVAALQAGYSLPVSYNMNLKPPSAARQMQWISSMQRSPSVVNGVDGQASPRGLPIRSPSANSTPAETRN